MKTILTVWALGVLLTVTFWGTIIYAALHFVSKFW